LLLATPVVAVVKEFDGIFEEDEEDEALLFLCSLSCCCCCCWWCPWWLYPRTWPFMPRTPLPLPPLPTELGLPPVTAAPLPESFRY
jgi:hypothetical protein